MPASVATKQKPMKPGSHMSERSAVARSLNSSTGMPMVKTNLFMPFAVSVSTTSVRRKTMPTTMRKNSGIMAFRLNIRLSMELAPWRAGARRPPRRRGGRPRLVHRAMVAQAAGAVEGRREVRTPTLQRIDRAHAGRCRIGRTRAGLAPASSMAPAGSRRHAARATEARAMRTARYANWLR